MGSFGSAITRLKELGYFEPLKAYIQDNKPFLGICVGQQVLFESSQESPGVQGLGIIPSCITKFDATVKAVPHMGWNGIQSVKSLTLDPWIQESDRYYFVHSYAGMITPESLESQNEFKEWISTLTTYENQTFVSSIQKGHVFATQFHPEKSGFAGLKVLESFIKYTNLFKVSLKQLDVKVDVKVDFKDWKFPPDSLSKRIIACLDVRSNDDGDLVVTKGDQYDVREKEDGHVRNLGNSKNENF